MAGQPRKVGALGGGGDGGDAGGDRHRHGQDVIDEQGSRGGQAGERAEVVLGDDVGPATGFVRLDGLAIRSDHDRE